MTMRRRARKRTRTTRNGAQHQRTERDAYLRRRAREFCAMVVRATEVREPARAPKGLDPETLFSNLVDIEADRKQQIAKALYPTHPQLAHEVRRCGTFVRVAYSPSTRETIVLDAYRRTCKQPLLCLPCAERHRDRTIERNLPRIEALLTDNPDQRSWMITPTVPTDTDFRSAFAHLYDNLRTFIGKCKEQRRGKLRSWPLHDATGVCVIEIAKSKKRCRPHAHCVAFTSNTVDQRALKAWWKRMTRTAHDIHIQPLWSDVGNRREDHVQRTLANVQNVLGYSQKDDLRLKARDRVHVWRQLREGSQRAPNLTITFGALHGNSGALDLPAPTDPARPEKQIPPDAVLYDFIRRADETVGVYRVFGSPHAHRPSVDAVSPHLR